MTASYEQEHDAVGDGWDIRHPRRGTEESHCTICFSKYDCDRIVGVIVFCVSDADNTVAQYTYDAFGVTISQSGAMCDVFRIRYSTKYLDAETGLYYYGYRFYSSSLMRWLNRDPIEEEGGVNLYCFCRNSSLHKVDLLGKIECCRCLYSGNLHSRDQSTGFSTIDGKKCFLSL